MGWMEQLAAWWVDYLAMATVLLVVVLAVGFAMRQPVQRMTMAWSAMVALVVLAVCCSVPGWPRWAVHSRLPITGQFTAKRSSTSNAGAAFKTVREYLEHRDRQPAADDSMARRGNLEKQPTGSTTNERGTKPAVSSSPPLNYWLLATAALLAGSALTLAWLILGHVRAWRLCRAATPAPEFAVAELRLLVGPQDQLPQLLVDNRLSSAGAVGLWQPTILLPAHALQSQEPSTASALRAILAHEWAHIERGDLWLLAFGRLLLILLYMHPLYWLLRRRVLADQELLADATAANHCGRHRYAETLVAWARQQPRSGSKVNWGLSIWERPSQLSKRIAVVIDENIKLRMACSRPWRIANMCIIAALAISLSLLTLNPVPQAVALEAKPKTTEIKPSTEPQATKEALPTVTVRGKCLDAKGQPIANAHVMLFRDANSKRDQTVPMGRIQIFPHTGGPQPPATLGSSARSSTPDRLLQETQTTADGEFQFANLPVDEAWQAHQAALWVVAQAPQKGTTFDYPSIQKTADGKLTIEPLKMSLQAAASLKGKISDAKGLPVVGAVVTCNSESCLICPRPGIVCAVTDSEGHYEINDLTRFDVRSLPPSVTEFGMMKQVSLTASVDHPDYEPGIIEYTKTPATVDLVLNPPAKLNGRVVFDDSGEPAAKASVRWVSKDYLTGAVETDQEGNFKILRLSPGKYTIAVERSDRPATTQSVDLAAGDNRLDVSLKQGAIIKGRLVDDATGKAVHFDRTFGAEVHAYIPERRDTTQNKVWVRKDGTFKLSVEPGRNVIVLPHPEWQLKDAATWSEKGVEVALGQTQEIELRVTPQASGWGSLFGQPVVRPAKVKEEPAQPAAPDMPEENWSLGDPEMDRIYGAFTRLPDEMLPTEPMDEETLDAMLESSAEVERKTVDGKECITSIQVGAIEPIGDPSLLAQSLYVSYSLLAHIDRYPDLEGLLMVGSPGNDQWLEALRGHKRLQSLQLVWSKNLTAKGVEHLTTIPHLKHLGMFGPHLDDKALFHLGRMPALETVTFGGKFSDVGVVALQRNSRLTGVALLGFGKSNFTDQSLRMLAGLPKLETLQIERVAGDQPFTDEGLKALATSKSLKTISVGGKGITDAGLRHLKELKTLENLTLERTSVTDQGGDELKKELPGLKLKIKRE